MNATLSLLQRTASSSEVLDRLVHQFGLSRRQAYRYLRRAQQAASPLPVPEQKVVFTVKLPPRLLSEVRQRARKEEASISIWVEQALRRALQPTPRSHG